MTTPNPSQWGYPTPSPQPSRRARITIHYGFALLAVFSLLGTVIPTIFWFVAAGNIATDPSGATDLQAARAASGIAGSFGFVWLLWGGMWTLIWAAFAVNHTLKARRGH